MQVCLEQVLNPGQTCSYEYDFGSTTELLVKVIAECEVEMKGRAIQILARNNPPIVACDVCGEPATSLCPQCIYEDNGCLCDACAKHLFTACMMLFLLLAACSRTDIRSSQHSAAHREPPAAVSPYRIMCSILLHAGKRPHGRGSLRRQ